MTCIVNFKTKKALKEAVEDKQEFWIEDPSFVNPRMFMAKELKNGEVIVVTNHPKRSWFAQIKNNSGGLEVR